MPVWTEGRKLTRSRSRTWRLAGSNLSLMVLRRCKGSYWPVLTRLASSRYLHDDMSRTDQFRADRNDSPSAKRSADNLLSLLNDGGEMLGFSSFRLSTDDHPTPAKGSSHL